MSEPKFTPGPWYVKPREEIKSMYGSSYTRTTILDSQDGGYSPRHVIAQIARGNGKEEANARLIAAAPEMYEFLNSLTSFGGEILLATLGEEGTKIYKEAVSIIAKVIGEEDK